MQLSPKIQSMFYTVLMVTLSFVAVAENEFAMQVPSSVTLPTGSDIRIGMSNPLSGPTAALGIELRQGVEIYFNKVNAEGGIYGRKLALISYDDGYEPIATISNTRALLEKDNAFLLFGYVGTPTSRVAAPIAIRAAVPYVAPFTGAKFLRQPIAPLIYNVRASYADETEAMVRYLVDKTGYKRIGLLIQDDAYGSSGRNGVTSALKQRGLEVVAVGKYPRNTSNIEPALAKLKAANPQAIILVGAYAPCAAFITQARQQGFNPLFMNISFVGTKGLIKAMGETGEGVFITQVMPSPLTTSSTIIQSYLKDSASYPPTHQPEALDTSSYGTLEGYVDARVLVHMLKAAGPALSRKQFVTVADNLNTFDIDGMGLTFTPLEHQGSHKVYLTRVENGRAVPVPLE